MKTINKQPKIRFKGYTDEWQQRKLNEFMDFSNGINAPKENYGKGRKMISVMDILSPNKITYQNIRNSVSVSEAIESKNKVENGDLIFVRSSEIVQEVGLSKAYTDSEYALYSGFSIRGKRKAEYNPLFMEINLNNGAGRKQIERKAGGSTRFNVSQEILNSIDVLMPIYEEQNKIADVFENINNTIALHQRKLEALEKTKKSFLQKMFPKKDETKPEIRFAGFTDDWEQRKFEDVLVSHPSKDYLAEPEENGVFTVIQQGEKPVVGLANGEPFKDYCSVVLFGDHTVSLYKPTTPFFVATDGLKILSSIELRSDYLYTTLEIYKPKPQGYKRHFTLLKKNFFKFTKNTEEQQKIGNFFKQLDDTIALHQRQLEVLKNMKTSFLQKMYI
ncbi:restriction endonuclease subunit S [Vagococcus lutrae]|uniref:restriction endonuclease subunit S n=1 Tax=Vagococcus lutrae TaxID=81947 RepID=UPI001B3488AE|nr:restriction endonuclease subunit S [Vagococcus lutrae]